MTQLKHASLKNIQITDNKFKKKIILKIIGRCP